MLNLKRKCNCCENKEGISVLEIWWKLHFENSFTETKKYKSRWRISSKFKTFSKICFICYGVFLAWLYFKYLLFITVAPNGNLFLIFLNLVLISLPIIIVEFMIIYTVGIECEN